MNSFRFSLKRRVLDRSEPRQRQGRHHGPLRHGPEGDLPPGHAQGHRGDRRRRQVAGQEAEGGHALAQ